MEFVAPHHVGSSWNRYQLCVSCIGRQILNHWTAREDPEAYICFFKSQSPTMLIYFTKLLHGSTWKKSETKTGMATHSSVLAWRIPGTGEPGGLLSMRSHRVGHDWRDLAAAAEGFKRHSFILMAQFTSHSPRLGCNMWFCWLMNSHFPYFWDLWTSSGDSNPHPSLPPGFHA